MPTAYKSSLASLISFSDLPDSFGKLLTGTAAELFSTTYFKNLQVSQSESGDAAFYDMELSTGTEMILEVPGVPGMKIILNKNFSNFPFSFNYQLPVLKYAKNFSLSAFSADTKAYYDLLLLISSISDAELLKSCIFNFIDDADPIQFFIDTCNTKYGYGLSKLGSSDDDVVIADLLTQLIAAEANVRTLVYNDYVDTKGTLTENLQNASTLFYDSMGVFNLESIRQLMLPSFTASLGLNAIDIEFPTWLFQPVPATDNRSTLRITDGANGLFKAIFDTKKGLEFELPSTPSLTFSRSEILNSGFILDFTNAKIDLSRTRNLPEAMLDGRPDDFLGVYVQDATITLPDIFQPNASPTIGGINAARRIVGQNLIIGTGGFSGRIALEEATGALPFKIGQIEIAIDEIAINFQLSKIIGSSISGRLKMPSLQANASACIVDVEIFIQDKNNFSLSADFTNDPTPPSISCFNVFDFSFNTLGFKIVNGRKGLHLSGILNFKDLIDIPLLSGLLPKNIVIQKLILWDDGSIDFEAGEIPLPAFNLQIGPVKLSVNGLSYSATKLNNRPYGVISFNGMIDTGSGGFDGQANGIRLYFSTDGGQKDIFLRLESLKVSIKIPGNATREQANILIDGYLSVQRKGDATPNAGNNEYGGGVSFALRNVGISGSAAMRMKPSVPSFIVDIGIEMSVPIPLAATGLGVYGFRGLIASNYHVSKTKVGLQEDDSYWLYYKAKKPIEGIHPDKFDGDNGFNVGAGVSLATMGDNGRSFSSKLFVMLGIPELFLLQGQAAMLKQRCGLDPGEDPPFSAFLVVDSNSISAGLGASFKAPSDGDSAGMVMDIQGAVQMAYFFGNSSAWYVNFGKDYPVEERIKAKLFSLIDAYAYLMISAQGIKGGAGASFGFKREYGPLRIGASSYINVGGQLSFKPVQMGGYLDMGGELYAKVYGFGFGLSLQALLAAEAPRPYKIKGSFKLSIDLPRPLKDINISANLEWSDAQRIGKDENFIPILNQEYNALPASAMNIHTQEKFAVLLKNGLAGVPTAQERNDLDNYIIPMDSYIDIEFANTPLLNLNGTDGPSNIRIKGNTENNLNYQYLSPPQRGFSEQAKHQFNITQINVKALNDAGTAWNNYDIWGNVISAMDLKSTPTDTSPGKLPITANEVNQLPNAYWQNTSPGSGKLNKLRILAQDMFSYLNQSYPGSINLEFSDFNGSQLFCSKTVITDTVINWENEEVGKTYPVSAANKLNNESTIKSDGKILKVADNSSNPFTKALHINSKDGVEITFTKPLKKVSIKLDIAIDMFDISGINNSYSNPNDKEGRYVQLLAIYYKRVAGPNDQNGNPTFKYEKITHQIVRPTNITENKITLEFNPTGGTTISKVVIKYNSYLYETPTANGMIAIGRTCFYNGWFDNMSFKGTIGKVEIYGPVPNYSNWSPASAQKDTIAKWRLDGNVNNSHNIQYDSPTYAQGNGGGIIQGGLAATLIGSPTTDPLGPWHPGNFYTFVNDSQAVEIPGANYYYLGYYGPISHYVWDPTNEEIWTPDIDFTYRVSATVRTTNASNTKRIIIDKRQFFRFGYFGFTIYLLNCRLCIDICYGQTFTYTYPVAPINDGLSKSIIFSFNPETQMLNVWLNGVKICNNLFIEELANFLSPISPRDLFIKEIAYQTEETFQFSQTAPTSANLKTEAENLRDGLGKTIQPVWRPDTIYAIDIQGNHLIDGFPAGGLNGTQKYSILFRTRGPVGFFHEYKNNYALPTEPVRKQKDFALVKTSDEFKLAHLKHYIDTDVSTPNADGNMIYTKPTFLLNPKIKLYYLQPYLKTMFRAWPAINNQNAERRYSLRPVIIDPDTKQEVPFISQWLLNQVGKSSANIDLWNAYSSQILPDNKVGFACNNIIGQLNKYSYQLEFALSQILKPEKVYDVHIIARFETSGNPASNYDVKVHSYSFKTSRYKTFIEQIQSFNLGTAKAKRLLNIPLADNTATDSLKVLRVLLGITTGTIPAATQLQVDKLIASYNTPFEAITEFLISDLRNIPKPSTTDVYEIINQLTGKRVGILIRNPESFIDTKLPDKFKFGAAGVTPSIECYKPNNDNITNQVKYIFSKDGANVFIYNTGLDLSGNADVAKIKFNYYEYKPEQKTFTFDSNTGTSTIIL